MTQKIGGKPGQMPGMFAPIDFVDCPYPAMELEHHARRVIRYKQGKKNTPCKYFQKNFQRKVTGRF